MIYQKCRDCKYRCRCCSSHFFDRNPRCSGCENHYDEFEPAEHMWCCPRDGQVIHHPLYDVNGHLVEVEFDRNLGIYKRKDDTHDQCG